MQSHVLAALVFERYVWYFGSLHPAFEMSCDTEYLEKNSFWFFRKRGLRRFGLCAYVLMIFVQTVRKIIGDLTERKTPFFQNDVEYVPKLSFWGLLCFFFGCNWRKLFWELPQISLRGTIRVFCSNAEPHSGCASFRTLRLVLWLFTSCVWDVLRYRILKKTAFDFFGNVVSVILYCVQVFWWISHKPSEKYWAISPKAKHKNSKKTLSTFQNCLFEGCSAFSLVVTEENCFENFLRSLYVEQYVFFVQMQSRVSAALVFEGYVRYFGSSHLAFEMSCDTEYLKKRLLIFSETWSSLFCIVCNMQLLWWFSYKPSEK